VERLHQDRRGVDGSGKAGEHPDEGDLAAVADGGQRLSSVAGPPTSTT
jgi:hypothetical protein